MWVVCIDLYQVFIGQVLRVKDRDEFPMLIVGNKADLEKNRQVRTVDCEPSMISLCLKVSRQECENMAKQLKTPFIECSAKNRMNVDQAFYELVRLIRKFQALERPITQGQAGAREKSKSACSLL